MISTGAEAANLPGRVVPAMRLRESARIVRRSSLRRPSVARSAAHSSVLQNRSAGARSAVQPASSSLLVQLIPPMALFLTLVFQLWIRVCIIETGYQLEASRQVAVNKDAEVRKLRSELAILTTPRVVMTRATKELGMVIPQQTNIRRIGGK